MEENIRVLLIDNHAAFSEELRSIILSTSDLELVGESADESQVIQLALTLQPDVVLMDSQIPKLNSVDMTRRIIYTSPHIGVIIHTMSEDDNSSFSAMRVGARGYLLKGASKAEILHILREVAKGEAILSAGLAYRLMNFFATSQSYNPSDTSMELTEREKEILNLFAQHMNNQEIASRLAISLKMVRNHAFNILSKVQVPIVRRQFSAHNK